MVTFHAMNGLRLILFDFNLGLRYQKAMFWAAFVVAVGMFIGSVIAVRNLWNASYREPLSFIPEPGRVFAMSLRRDFDVALPFAKKGL